MLSRPLIKNLSRLNFMQRESLRVGGWSPELQRYLAQHQLHLGNIIAHAGLMNVALVKFLGGNVGDHVFEFDVGGVPAAVIEAILFNHSREPFAADLVAWPLNDPGAFATAMGADDGADVLGPVNMIGRHGEALVVHRTPLAWLGAGCAGCVPLKPGARHWLIRASGPFIVEDVDHGQEVRELLGGNAARHRFLVPKSAVAS